MTRNTQGMYSLDRGKLGHSSSLLRIPQFSQPRFTPPTLLWTMPHNLRPASLTIAIRPYNGALIHHSLLCTPLLQTSLGLFPPRLSPTFGEPFTRDNIVAVLARMTILGLHRSARSPLQTMYPALWYTHQHHLMYSLLILAPWTARPQLPVLPISTAPTYPH